jgi:hypothetical protein
VLPLHEDEQGLSLLGDTADRRSTVDDLSLRLRDRRAIFSMLIYTDFSRSYTEICASIRSFHFLAMMLFKYDDAS